MRFGTPHSILWKFAPRLFGKHAHYNAVNSVFDMVFDFTMKAIMNAMDLPSLAVICGSCTAGAAYVPVRATTHRSERDRAYYEKG